MNGGAGDIRLRISGGAHPSFLRIDGGTLLYEFLYELPGNSHDTAVESAPQPRASPSQQAPGCQLPVSGKGRLLSHQTRPGAVAASRDTLFEMTAGEPARKSPPKGVSASVAASGVCFWLGNLTLSFLVSLRQQRQEA